MDIRNFFGPVSTKKGKDEKTKGGSNHVDKKEEKNSAKEVKKRGNSGPKQKDGSGDGKEKSRKRKKDSLSSDEFGSDEGLGKTDKKKRGKKTQRIIESDSDEDPLPVKSRTKKKKDAVVFIEDSDEEAPKMKKRSSLDSFVKVTPPKPHKEEKKKTPEKKTPVSVADFFGGGSIQRSERKISATKRKTPEEPIVVEDVEMHDDADFVQALEQLDDHQPKKLKREKTPKKKSPAKINGDESSSLAGKLSGRMKTKVDDTPAHSGKTDKNGNVCIPETPDVKKPSPLKNSSKKKSPTKPQMTITPNKKSPTSPSTKKTSPSTKSPAEEGETSGTPKLNKRASYRNYLNREGPRALGSKEIPEGADNCLEGLTFVLTGVMESMERDEAKSVIEKYGGKVTGSISKKTSYIVAGRDAGESKMAKAAQFKTKVLDEDELLDLIRKQPGKKSKYVIQAEETLKKESSLKADDKNTSLKKKLSDSFSHKPNKSEVKRDTSVSEKSKSVRPSPSKTKSDQSHESLLWVDKYKPTSVKQIIGQQGDKSNAKKLLHWLTHWHKNQSAGIKPTGKFFGKDDGTGYKSALLSGPPGIGKTTTATLVCKEIGFSYIELNASDTRSKKSLKEVVAESLNNQTLVDFMGETKHNTGGHSHCIIMDEVDGMAGNEDRGGLQELLQLIKQSKIPVICICNDRNSPKMRTLSNHCFDLRFYKPRLEQIKGAMMTLAYKEGLKISPPALNEIILAANQDIRQVIHNMSMWCAADKSLNYEQAKSDAQKAKKDMKLGPFDVCRKVFVGGEETAHMTIHDKSDLFFHDYSIAPLFVQENYPSVTPFTARGNLSKHLSILARTADSICDGDLADRKIRSGQNWGLLPVEAMYASVIPGEYMRGGLPHMVAFPSWLGKNSSRTKMERILQELRIHMRLQISGDKKGLNMDYLPVLRHALTDPLVKDASDGVSDVINLMDNYDIIKEDFDNILEVTKWPNSKDPLSSLESKTKAAFTRAYNKQIHLTPYATGSVVKKRRGRAQALDEDVLGGEEGEAALLMASDEEDEDSLENDTMVKIKKPAAKGKGAASDKGKETKGKGKGKGRGKGRS